MSQSIVDTQVRKRNIERCREKGIVLPTFAQMREPEGSGRDPGKAFPASGSGT